MSKAKKLNVISSYREKSKTALASISSRRDSCALYVRIIILVHLSDRVVAYVDRFKSVFEGPFWFRC